jgi:hypothetical protein
MVDDLVQRVVFVGLGGVENVDETIRAGGEEKSRVSRMQLKGCDGVGVGFYIGTEGD